MQYKEKDVTNEIKIKGYVDQVGQFQGVGIRVAANSHKERAEWHQNKLHGTVKVTFASGNTYWGEYKDDKKEGYATYEYTSGSRYIGQWM